MNIVHLCIIPAVYQRLYNPGVEHWRLQPLCNVFCHVYEKSLKWLEIDNISSASKHEPKSSNRFPSSNGCILTMFPSKFGHNWIILFTFMRPKNCAFNISFNKVADAKIWWPANSGDLRYSSTKKSFLSRCFSLSIIILCVYLIVSILRGETDVFCMQFHAFIQFIICQQKLLVLFGKRSSWNSFRILPKENFVSASPSKTYVPYTNMTLRSFVNSSTYEWFSYWAFNLSILCEFSTIWL